MPIVSLIMLPMPTAVRSSDTFEIGRAPTAAYLTPTGLVFSSSGGDGRWPSFARKSPGRCEVAKMVKTQHCQDASHLDPKTASTPPVRRDAGAVPRLRPRPERRGPVLPGSVVVLVVGRAIGDC